MARPTRPTQACSPVSRELVCGDHVGLAEQPSRQASGLDLVAQGGRADAEFDGGFGEGEHRLLLVGRGHEVGLHLVEPAFEGLATALVGPDPDLIGVEAVGVVPGVSKGALELGPAVGPFLPGLAHLLEFVAKLGSPACKLGDRNHDGAARDRSPVGSSALD